MNARLPHVVLIEDDDSTRSALTSLVEHQGFTVSGVQNLLDARRLIEEHPPGVILCDIRLPDGNGIDLLREVRASSTAEFVLITGFATVDLAVEALRLGASDFITKPVDLEYLKRVLSRLHRTARMREEIGALRKELRLLGRFGRLIGKSPAMQRVYDLLARISQTEAPVLLTGETGTGKELGAETLHDLGRRRDKPFLAVNCGAIAANMIESELFGHERGSFTGAAQKHVGYFERAHGGTLLLDEIAEMQPDLQVKLLRVLESGKLTRVGGEKEVAVDVRILAATNQSPQAAIAGKRLREDLYYRLKVFEIAMPPLRERADDVALLAEHFLQILNRDAGASKLFTSDALFALRSHSWPGNVRELSNAVRAGFVMSDRYIKTDHLGLSFHREAVDLRTDVEALPAVLPAASKMDVSRGVFVPIGATAEDAERRVIIATLDECGGNKEKTARMLGMSLKTVYKRLRVYGTAALEDQAGASDG